MQINTFLSTGSMKLPSGAACVDPDISDISLAGGQRRWLASWPSYPVLLPPLALPLTHLAVLLTPRAGQKRRRGDVATVLGGGLRRTILSALMPVN